MQKNNQAFMEITRAMRSYPLILLHLNYWADPNPPIYASNLESLEEIDILNNRRPTSKHQTSNTSVNREGAGGGYATQNSEAWNLPPAYSLLMGPH